MSKNYNDLQSEIRRLKTRLKRMSREKANLQMAVDLINQISTVVGLDNVVERILQILIAAIGGSNIAIYYETGGRWRYTDILGDQKWLAEPGDELVARAVESHRFQKSVERGESTMHLPGFSESDETWVYPLAVHDKLFGAIRLQGMAVEYAHYRENIDPFIKYAALVLYHEVSNVRRLDAAYQKVVRAQEQLQTSNRLLTSVIDNSPQAIIAFDLKGMVTLWNKAAEEMFAWTAHEIVGQKPDLFPDSGSGTQSEPLKEVLTGRSVTDRELKCHRKAGTRFDASLSASPIMDAEQTVRGGMAVIADISWRKNMEEQIQRIQKMESIGNLAGGIAHDFNNILFPIVGMSELLLEDLPAHSMEHENAQEIFKAGKRAIDLVKQILTFSRRSKHKMMPIRIQQIIVEALKLSRSTIPANIEIARHIQNDCGLVMGDQSQVHQIAMNLITNAYHAVEENAGTITVRLKEKDLSQSVLQDTALEPGRYVVLTVSDTGSGIEPAVKDKIFDPYFTTKDQGKGTGLGLSVVYGIVKEHRGDITVRSAPGKGATFKVYLPLMLKAAQVAPREKPIVDQSGTESILLVDDEEPIVHVERQMLERLGYRVVVRNSSTDALAVFEADPEAFDLVITDMTMPGMTGDQLAGAMLAVKPDIPVIICTGYSARINPEKSKAIGIKGFILKPVDRSELALLVRRLLDESNGRLQSQGRGTNKLPRRAH